MALLFGVVHRATSDDTIEHPGVGWPAAAPPPRIVHPSGVLCNVHACAARYHEWQATPVNEQRVWSAYWCSTHSTPRTSFWLRTVNNVYTRLRGLWDLSILTDRRTVKRAKLRSQCTRVTWSVETRIVGMHACGVKFAGSSYFVVR